LAITVTTTLTAVGNYYLDQKDIEEHLDIVMAVSAMSYQVLLGNDIHKRSLPEIQDALNTIPNKIGAYFKKSLLDFQSPKHYLDKFSFQIWSKEGKLLLHSHSAPAESLSNKINGLHDKTYHNKKWRVFSITNPVTGTETVVGERYDTRKELGQLITEDDLYIMLLTFPLCALLIWIIIGRGLKSLDRVAEEVANRAPTHLTPVKIDMVPEEIKPLVDELNKLFYRLQEAFEREKRFAGDAAHELRTPLASLKAQAQIALNTANIKEKNTAVEKLIESVKRSTHIIEQLLTMSKLVPDAASLNDTSKISLPKIAREIIAMLAPAAIEKEIEISFESEKNCPKLSGNATAIGILIRNLVDNAIRYCPVGGLVHVLVVSTPDTLVLEVKDNGPGIPNALKERVFERFFRVVGNKSPGSGLGLGIVQQICELHNANLTLKNPEEGSGLIVSICFPRD